ncbi:hypothetical protein [Aliivibrio fischeri]|uniref:Transposase n=1 Tax=Aliivibrio fischeri TaxID=668 RepID=A0A510UMY1_ALIFS|nr:hypothetical protein [Aliivibrio fischeri]GEK15997.1 hypothetical protein AFI02nite_40330 [Aliivibrio fischeri]
MKTINIDHIKEKLIPKSHDHNSLRQKRRYKSKLDPYRYEILTLYNELNYSLGTIQIWLTEKKEISVSRSTLLTRLKYWEDLKSKE